MDVNILDYLSEEEIKEICIDEIRSKIRSTFKEPDVARVISNSAYYKYYDLVDEHITEEHKETIIETVEKCVNDAKSYNVFRYHYLTEEPKSLASKLLEQTINDNKEKIVNNINLIIENMLNNNDENYEKLIEKITDGMWNGFTLKFEK